MSSQLTDKIVVITGAAKGIGFEIADKFLKNNAKVVIVLDVDESEGIKATNQLKENYGSSKAVFIKCDVTKDLENVYKEIIEKYETVDVLVNNAGIFNDGRVKETIDINVLAVINWTTKFYEHMRKDKNGKGGTVLNVISLCGFWIMEYAPIYQASKFAMFGFTKCLGHSMNYDRTGVRLIGICPGFTKTSLIESPRPWDESVSEEFVEYLTRQVWQTADAVGEAAVDVFNRAPSGTNWVIDGAKPIFEVK